MNLLLYENRLHGNNDYPYVCYSYGNFFHPTQVSAHWHHEVEIIYVKKGHLNVSISGNDYQMDDGSIIIVNPSELHLMSTESQDIEYYTMLFPLEYISFQANDILESEYFLPLRSGKIHFKNVIDNQEANEKLIKVCEKLISIPYDDKYRQLEIKILLLRFIQILIVYSQMTKKITGSSDFDKEMISFIEKNYKSEVSLTVLSQHFHLSEKYISRYFKEHFRVPLTQFVKQLRVEHAKKLLVSSSKTISEITTECGFQNTSHFIRTFKSVYYESPLQYRKSYRNE